MRSGGRAGRGAGCRGAAATTYGATSATIRTGGAGGTELTRKGPARRLRTVLGLAGAEAWLLSRNVLALAGLLVGSLVAWNSLRPAEPLWWNAAWQIGYGQVLLAATVLVAAQLAIGRASRDGMQELYDSFPVSAATRTLAQLTGWCALTVADGTATGPYPTAPIRRALMLYLVAKTSCRSSATWMMASRPSRPSSRSASMAPAPR
jgi:hypothetical protein